MIAPSLSSLAFLLLVVFLAMTRVSYASTAVYEAQSSTASTPSSKGELSLEATLSKHTAGKEKTADNSDTQEETMHGGTSEDDNEESSEEQGSSEESDDSTCSLTLRVPVSAVNGCDQVKGLEENLKQIKHGFNSRLDVLEHRVSDVLSDEGDRDSLQHLEDKVYRLQVQLDDALDLTKHGSRHPVLNRIIQNLRRERVSRTALEKRLQDLEKRNQDIDCRLMGRPGIYLIRPFRGPGKMKVYCDNTWTVIQKRYNGTVNFFQNWESYRRGFGNMDGEFWLGNDNIHYLTTQSKYKLRIEMMDWYGREYFAEYSHFWIESVNNKFRLHVQGFTGNLVDSILREDSKFNHNGMEFSTHDEDNDKNPTINCALKYQGAWWYNDCYASNLNGRHCQPEEPDMLSCIVWYGMLEKYTMEKVTMKVKENA